MPGLYVHIPFCVRKCLYCGFYVVPHGTGPLSQRLRELESTDNRRFIDALEREICGLPAAFKPKTLYLGGGTPTELSTPDFTRLLEALHRHLDLSDLREFTCEANPGTLTADKIACFKRFGITRVSLGVQSFQPEVLSFLTRIHSPEESIAAFHQLREAEIPTISLDLMFALPGTTLETVQQDIAQLIELKPDHTTCYALDIEPTSGLITMMRDGHIEPLDDDIAFAQYQELRTQLTRAGFQQYEIFAFARPGFECLHNHNYWAAGSYLGIGPSAHSHWEGQRYQNIPDLPRYLKAIEGDEGVHDEPEVLKPEEKARETLIIGLRRRAGVDRTAFEQQTGFDYRALYDNEIDALIDRELLEESAGILRLREEALFISDSVFRELV
jgi:oxygen-independent coproporphyrinogen-3 oxidase